MPKVSARDISELDPDGRRHLSIDDSIPSRRLRTRPPARDEASKEPLTQLDPSPPRNPEPSRPHGNGPRVRSLPMSRSHQRQESFSLGPRLTKTGRISKAKKGVKDAHVCGQCGKVRAYISSHPHRRTFSKILELPSLLSSIISFA
jgi:hypothetical protein